MIFPEHCKHVGLANGKPLGDRVYFLSRYLICETAGGVEIAAVEPGPGGGLMRPIRSITTLASAGEITRHPERVNLHDRGDLIRRALESPTRCTIFTGHDEHQTFVLDPDPADLITLHVYDIEPPFPHLSRTLRALAEAGTFGELEITLHHHVKDIREIDADMYPCHAAGFDHTLDRDRPQTGERIAGCLTARQILAECYGNDFSVIDICPANAVREEPFIARCCRSERTGIGKTNGFFGGIVHWGATPREILAMVEKIIEQWRKQE